MQVSPLTRSGPNFILVLASPWSRRTGFGHGRREAAAAIDDRRTDNRRSPANGTYRISSNDVRTERPRQTARRGTVAIERAAVGSTGRTRIEHPHVSAIHPDGDRPRRGRHADRRRRKRVRRLSRGRGVDPVRAQPPRSRRAGPGDARSRTPDTHPRPDHPRTRGVSRYAVGDLPAGVRRERPRPVL